MLREAFENDYHPGTKPLVTCYVPTHNRADLLIDRSLKSICAQTYTNLEIIVAAHGCTDDTVKRVKALGDSRIKVLEVPRKRTYPPIIENHWFAGPVVPANAALAAARGEWIARNDDDDEWTPDHIERLLIFAQSFGYEFVSGRHDVKQLDGVEYINEPYHFQVGESDIRIGGVQTWLYRSYLGAFRFNPDCWRKRWNRVNDTDLQDRFVRAGVRIGYLNQTVTHITPRPGETAVGLVAYKKDAENKSQQLAF